MTKKPGKRNSPSVRSAKGKASFEKGARFEDDVAELYRLLGAEITRNIEISHKKVDILATFSIPGSTAKHRIIVECKDEKRRVADNQRVMEFYGLLENARQLGIADSAEIITRVPWSDAAKGFAHDKNIGLFTYREKIAQLIDFTPYLNDLVLRFDVHDDRRPNDPPLGAYYVSSSAERMVEKRKQKIPKVDDHLIKWSMATNGERHLAILGEYGTGKSSLCQKIARDLAAAYLKSPTSTRIPIVLNLREFTKKLDIEAFITSFLDRDCGVFNPRYRLFKAMNDAGILLILFDAFDEMAVRVDADTLEVNLQEIEKLAASAQSKVILTSRIEYFTSTEEEERALRPKGNVIETRSAQYDPLYLITWDTKQVDSFLEKRVPLVKGATRPWSYYRDQIRRIPGLTDLSRRPVLLDMIVKTLPELISSGKPINRPNLYETYLIGEIKRQKITKRRELVLAEKARFSLLQSLSVDIYSGEVSSITFSDALNRISKLVNPPRSELEAYTREFLTCSFLMRQGDEFRFSHNSIMEYLTAKSLLEEINQNNPTVFGRQILRPIVAGFLADLTPNLSVLWDWIESTRSEIKLGLKYLGGNAATVLHLLDKDIMRGKDLSNTDLTGARLWGANLEDTNLDGTILKGVNLVKARFLETQLARSLIDNTDMCFFIYGELEPPQEEDEEDEDPRKRVRSIITKSYDFFGSIPGLDFQLCPDPHIQGNLYIHWLQYQVTTTKALESIYRTAPSYPWIKAIAIYSNEIDGLLSIVPLTMQTYILSQMRPRSTVFDDEI